MQRDPRHDVIGPSTRPIATDEQLSFCTTCLRKLEPLVLVNKIQYSKLKLQHHKNQAAKLNSTPNWSK